MNNRVIWLFIIVGAKSYTGNTNLNYMSNPHVIAKGMWYCKIVDFRSWQIFCKILIEKKFCFLKEKKDLKMIGNQIKIRQRNVKGERQNNESKIGLYNLSVNIEENKSRCCFD